MSRINKIKTFGLIMICFLLFFFFLIIYYPNFLKNDNYTTTNTVKVIGKRNNKEFIITVMDKDYDKNRYVKFDIYVEDENVWNLIEVDQTYFVVYSNIKEKLILYQIEKIEDFKE